VSWVQILVNLAGLVLIVAIVRYFWLSRKEGVIAVATAGVQMVNVLVKGGYDPDKITVKKDLPVRLTFTRQESSMCSEIVQFDKLGKSYTLPEGESVVVEFTPREAGEIPFQCQMGMLRGRVVVTE